MDLSFIVTITGEKFFIPGLEEKKIVFLLIYNIAYKSKHLPQPKYKGFYYFYCNHIHSKWILLGVIYY